MKETVLMIAALSGGVLAGGNPTLTHTLDSATSPVLTLMMFVIGCSLAGQPTAFFGRRLLSLRLILLPAVVVVGTAVGALTAAAVLPAVDLNSALVVASGFGFYTMSGAVVTEHVGSHLGSVALVSNATRELLTLLMAPLLVKCFRDNSVVAAAGATSMDVCLGVIQRHEGKGSVYPAITSGFALTIAAPLLTLFLLRL